MGNITVLNVGGLKVNNEYAYDLLWTNPNPESTFEAQQIPISVYGYNILLIEHTWESRDSVYQSYVLCETFKYQKITPRSANEGIPSRTVYCAKDYVNFSKALKWYEISGSAPVYDNNYVIPLRIYGIR